MATAQEWQSRVYLLRLQALVIDIGTIVVRNIFDQRRPNVPLNIFLRRERKKIMQLLESKIITRHEFDLLFPLDGHPTTADMDISLLACLLLRLESFGLDVPPPALVVDTSLQLAINSVGNDLSNMMTFRYELLDMTSTTYIQQETFEYKWAKIEQVLNRLNAFVPNPVPNMQQLIADCKNRPLDLKKTMDQWSETDIQIESGWGPTCVSLKRHDSVKEDIDVVGVDIIKEDVAIVKTAVERIAEVQNEADDESNAEEKQFAGSIAMKAKVADDIESGLPPPEFESLSTFLATYKGDIKSGAHVYFNSILYAAFKAFGDSNAGENRCADSIVRKAKFEADRESDAGEKQFADSIAMEAKLKADDGSDAVDKHFADSIVMKANLEADDESDAGDKHFADSIVMKAKLEADDESDAGDKHFADSIVMKAKLEGRLPSASELAVLCQTYGRKSDKLKHVCDTICDHIKDECKHIVNVWPSYRPFEENIIVFCVITDIPCERIICSYSVVQRAIDEYSIEEREILKQELERGLEFTDDAVENCIDYNADKFMDNHKNLSVMSASLLKSEKFATSLEKVSQQVCIVLLVPIKGFIPLSEEAFPKYIDDFPVDVREGNFRYKFGGRPNDTHESLKMGCAIEGDEAGTLGGFLDYNEHGICCLTVAHVMLSVTKMKRTFPGQYIPPSFELCYQPKKPNAFGCLVKAIAIEGNNDKSGMDVALVKIDKRIPLNGRFPDAENETYLEQGSSSTELQYCTGEVLEKDKVTRNQSVLKYGQTSTLTNGKVRMKSFTARDTSEGYSYTLKKQIQVCSADGPFSDEGDSGSLVFVKGNDSQLVAIGMLVGGLDSYDVVTPICDILRELDTPLSLKTFPHST